MNNKVIHLGVGEIGLFCQIEKNQMDNDGSDPADQDRTSDSKSAGSMFYTIRFMDTLILQERDAPELSISCFGRR